MIFSRSEFAPDERAKNLMKRPLPPPTDALIAGFDQALRTLVGYRPQRARRPYPALDCASLALPEAARVRAGSLMRVNHTGEVCAQALYLGQATASTAPAQRAMLQAAAAEEIDHLVWCAQRLEELEARPSRLNFAWFCGAFTLGTVAGLCGERASLGFLAETEHQVVAHLEAHLALLPREDQASRLIVGQMRRDEAKHAATARRQGGLELPLIVRWCMKLQAKVMTSIAARL